MIIAIDGPAGSGKSTVARLLAGKLGFLYLDTGAMYRALTLKVIREKVVSGDEEKIESLAAGLDFRFADGRVLLDQEDVTAAIRTPQIDKAISDVCKIKKVREHIVALAQKVAGQNPCVTEGRDTTTVIFPGAEFKFYLDADFNVRAKRRHDELSAKGIKVTLEEVSRDLKKRDEADISRVVGPLKKSADAHFMDTTNYSIEEVVEILARKTRAG